MCLFFLASTAFSQVVVKTNKKRTPRKVVVKSNQPNHTLRVKTNRVKTNRVKTNRNRVVIAKPARPKVIVKRPNRSRRGYIWTEGYWQWSNFYNNYIWIEGNWRLIKKGHHWMSGYWEVSPGGFFWVEGYWYR